MELKIIIMDLQVVIIVIKINKILITPINNQAQLKPK